MTVESELRERGYAVIEDSHSEEDVHAFREALTSLHARFDSPPPYAARARELSARVLLNPTGFVVFELLGECPELSSRVLSPAVVQAARALLGDDMHLELTGANVSDASRPFFSWHNHLGGIDVEEHRASGDAPQFARSERLIAVLYLDETDADGGELLVMPRQIDDATEPLGDTMAEHWEGQVTVPVPRGATLLLEQCSWHAVRPMRRAGLRMFVGAYFTASHAPPTRNVDRSLEALQTDDPLLRSVLPHRG